MGNFYQDRRVPSTEELNETFVRFHDAVRTGLAMDREKTIALIQRLLPLDVLACIMDKKFEMVETIAIPVTISRSRETILAFWLQQIRDQIQKDHRK